MQVTMLPDAQKRPRRIAVGTFDGVHLGHREVIDDADTVLTFYPHPSMVVAPAHTPKLLTSLARKTELIASLGVRELIVIPFDRDFAQRSAQEFIDEVLVGGLGATEVAVGENFRFGHRAQGDAELLSSDARFATRVVPLLEVDGEVVSSSHIRGLVLAGEVELAAHFLGAPFQLAGEVVHGDKRGRTLGYPTANLRLDAGCGLRHGIYAVRVAIADKRYEGVASFGRRPTFDQSAVLLEVFLFDFSGDLYGQVLDVAFIEWIRPELKFDSVEALVRRMDEDSAAARAALARAPHAFPKLGAIAA
jgi:riboflavin kinase / FMN adenylyltransferase